MKKPLIAAAVIVVLTLVVWASDNGPETMQGIGIQYGAQSDTGPFRGEFPSAWEGAIRVRGERAGRPVSGSGYLEMTGYDAER